MRRLLLLSTALVGLALAVPAKADVVLDTNGQGGTGNNVVFSSVANSSLILGHLNGQNNEIVRFRDLSGNGNFSGSANGNDIKIINTRDLDITVFDAANLVQLGTTRDIFSLKGTGNVFFRLTVAEADGSLQTVNFTNAGAGYNLGNGNQQNGFDFKTINGEVITDLDLFLGVGGMINDFEHFRIDAAPIPQVAAVPEPATWAMMLLGFMGIVVMGARNRRRDGHAFRLA